MAMAAGCAIECTASRRRAKSGRLHVGRANERARVIFGGVREVDHDRRRRQDRAPRCADSAEPARNTTLASRKRRLFQAPNQRGLIAHRGQGAGLFSSLGDEFQIHGQSRLSPRRSRTSRPISDSLPTSAQVCDISQSDAPASAAAGPAHDDGGGYRRGGWRCRRPHRSRPSAAAPGGHNSRSQKPGRPSR